MRKVRQKSIWQDFYLKVIRNMERKFITVIIVAAASLGKDRSDQWHKHTHTHGWSVEGWTELRHPPIIIVSSNGSRKKLKSTRQMDESVGQWANRSCSVIDYAKDKNPLTFTTKACFTRPNAKNWTIQISVILSPFSRIFRMVVIHKKNKHHKLPHPRLAPLFPTMVCTLESGKKQKK